MTDKPRDVVIGLKTIAMRGAAVQPVTSTPARPLKRRVFTDAQWSYLYTLSTDELKRRISQGLVLIGLLYRPEMLNMTQPQADMISSNLRYQIDAIQAIIDTRGSHDGLQQAE